MSTYADMLATARWLGYAGLIPFFILAFATRANVYEPHTATLFIYYSAIILSFLGGIRWGVYAAAPEPDARHLWIGIGLSLWAWASLVPVNTQCQMALLLAGHIAAGFSDLKCKSSGQRPWLRRLRLELSGAVMVLHIVALTWNGD